MKVQYTTDPIGILYHLQRSLCAKVEKKCVNRKIKTLAVKKDRVWYYKSMHELFFNGHKSIFEKGKQNVLAQ